MCTRAVSTHTHTHKHIILLLYFLRAQACAVRQTRRVRSRSRVGCYCFRCCAFVQISLSSFNTVAARCCSRPAENIALENGPLCCFSERIKRELCLAIKTEIYDFLKRFVCLFSSTRPCNSNRVYARARVLYSKNNDYDRGENSTDVYKRYDSDTRARRYCYYYHYCTLVCMYALQRSISHMTAAYTPTYTRIHIFSRQNPVGTQTRVIIIIISVVNLILKTIEKRKYTVMV